MKNKRLLRSIIAIVLCAVMLSGIVAVGVDAFQKKTITPSIDKDNNLPVVKPKDPINSSASASVTTENGATTKDVTLESEDGAIWAVVPSGTLLNDGATKVTLTVEELDNSQANVELEANEQKSSIDVHVEGVSANNTTPIKVYIKELLPVGLNMGNYKFYHVENGTTVEMTLLGDSEPVHNNYTYDPATGDCVLYLASFSEVAVVNDTDNAWNGTVATAFADGTGTEADPYIIANADQLAYLSQIVSKDNEDEDETNDYGNKHYKLIADINLGGESQVFYPIGYWAKQNDKNSVGEEWYTYGGSFKGVFDGNGHTIKNIYQNTWAMNGDYDNGYWNDAMGLFGYVHGGTVQNLTVDNFSSDGEFTPTGVIAAYADGNSEFKNIAITNCNPRVYNTGNGGIVGIAGDTRALDDDHITFSNITIDNTNKISALWGSWDVACGGLVGMYRGNVDANGNATGDTITFTNCHVAAQIDVNNDVCANYQYYAYRYAGMIIGSVRHNTVNDGKTIPNMTGISATGCTVNYGTWNSYYYCELKDNTIASYTHDYQFSRLTQVDAVDVENMTVTINGDTTAIPTSGRYNYVIVNDEHSTENATCYHFVDGEVHNHASAGTETVNGQEGVLIENNQHIYLPFHQLFTGYSWGVSSIGLEKYSGIVTNLDITESDKNESVEKFEKVDNITGILTGSTITIDSLFNAKDGAIINNSGVWVTIEKVDENSGVSGTFTADTTDWTKGKITFEGLGELIITIQDYDYCTPTTITVEIKECVEKFTSKTVNAQNAYSQITLGTLFDAKNDVTIGDVTAIVTDPSGKETTINGTSADWSTQEIGLTKDGTWTVVIKDNDFCNDTKTSFSVNKVDKFTKKFDKDFLYRVGNIGTVSLDNIFNEISTDISLSSVNVDVVAVAGNAVGTFTADSTWSNGKIQFTGTGVVEVTISADGANSVSIKLEVVDAKNATEIMNAQANNVVLLKDVSGTLSVSGGYTFYGNGFTITLPNDAQSNYSAGFVGFVNLSSGNLDNVKIIGPVYPETYIYQSQAQDSSNTSKANYFYNTVIINGGTCTISNSYISGSRCALYVKSADSVTIDNSTISGGSYANIEIYSSTPVTLNNVTTVQKETADTFNKGKNMIGMGVIVNNENASITINGNLNQYNWVTKAQWDSMVPDAYANAFPNLFTDSNFTNYQKSYKNETYVNLGFIFACDWNFEKQIADNRTNADIVYEKQDVSLGGKAGGVYSITSDLTDALYNAPSYVSSAQGAVKPIITPDYTSKNNEPAQPDSNDYCYYSSTDGKYLISFDDGDTKAWYYDILTFTKGTTVLSYDVKVSGNAIIDTTNKTITFSEAGDYIVTYTYTDDYNYGLSDGAITTYSATYTKDIKITVYEVVDTSAKTDFAFGSNGFRAETINNVTYVMPNVTATVDSNTAGIRKTTIGGVDIYYPVVSMHKSGSSSWYNYFSVFEAITITDLDGTILNTSLTAMPSGLTVIGGFILDANGNVSTAESANKTSIFNYSTGKEIKCSTYSTYGLCYYPDSQFSKTGTSNRAEQTIVAKYQYTDSNGKVFYYYVGYWCEEHTKSSVCVTPDTLVTMADGTKKEIQNVTVGESVIAWNFYTGKYEAVPASLVQNHGSDYMNVLHLYFEDGTELKVLGEHGIYDYDLNTFIFIDEKDVENYIGHNFVKQNGDSFTTVKLVDYKVTNEYTSAYTILSTDHYNVILEDMFTVTPAHVGGNFFNPFDVNENMMYDEDAVKADIEKYGLYTYEEFAHVLTYEQFEALGIAEFKVSVGKGLITYEGLIYLIENFVNKF